ncbi:FAD binding domain-containing protein [Aspergillus leporis]|uniref:FAD binding domain-containing protein n=1 Tax=Aspergillus leporis TaxID=41062 RepID=A0A5N5WIW7_9EURO|nr:FAD binding domain-containing protein [Aspergillus leporis]
MATLPESYTDVLIIGAGPSGLAAAYWMARYGVDARIIDRRNTKVFRGHADGLRAGTIELFDSMGFQHRLAYEGMEVGEWGVWGPDENGQLKRQKLYHSHSLDGLPYRTIALGQGRIERFILDTIKDCSNLEVERGVRTESLEYDESLEDSYEEYPITVRLRTLTKEEASIGLTCGDAQSLSRDDVAADDVEDLDPSRKNEPGTVETVKAKYIIGCDGAHSWTRKQLGIPSTGATMEHIWGVIDVVPITNFPDVRRGITVASEQGTLLLVPRERQLVRFYVPLVEFDGSLGRFDRSSITLDMIREKVQELLKPYRFDFKVCDWWTTYQIGQSLAQKFTKGRIYLAGDAAHTHSPKVGLALVAQEVAHPSILDTYEPERLRIAEMLVDFDRRFSPLFAKQPGNLDLDSRKKYEAMKGVLNSTELFAEGLMSQYEDSLLVHRCRFRILLLAGDIRVEAQKRRVLAFGEYLTSANSVLRRFASNNRGLNAAIEVVTIHSAPVEEVELFDFPEVFQSLNENNGCDYDRVWSDGDCQWDGQCNGIAYEKWGADRLKGALVALRPDQFIGWMGGLEDVDGLSRYFAGIFRNPN